MRGSVAAFLALFVAFAISNVACLVAIKEGSRVSVKFRAKNEAFCHDEKPGLIKATGVVCKIEGEYASVLWDHFAATGIAQRCRTLKPEYAHGRAEWVKSDAGTWKQEWAGANCGDVPTNNPGLKPKYKLKRLVAIGEGSRVVMSYHTKNAAVCHNDAVGKVRVSGVICKMEGDQATVLWDTVSNRKIHDSCKTQKPEFASGHATWLRGQQDVNWHKQIVGEKCGEDPTGNTDLKAKYHIGRLDAVDEGSRVRFKVTLKRDTLCADEPTVFIAKGKVCKVEGEYATVMWRALINTKPAARCHTKKRYVDGKIKWTRAEKKDKVDWIQKMLGENCGQDPTENTELKVKFPIAHLKVVDRKPRAPTPSGSPVPSPSPSPSAAAH